jgi:hypothetical protein
VPLTFATQVAVCEVLIEEGVALTAIPVTVTGVGSAEVFMDAVPDLLPSCVDVAVQVPTPGPAGEKTPSWVIAPPVAVHVTALL